MPTTSSTEIVGRKTIGSAAVTLATKVARIANANGTAKASPHPQHLDLAPGELSGEPVSVADQVVVNSALQVGACSVSARP